MDQRSRLWPARIPVLRDHSADGGAQVSNFVDRRFSSTLLGLPLSRSRAGPADCLAASISASAPSSENEAWLVLHIRAPIFSRLFEAQPAMGAHILSTPSSSRTPPPLPPRSPSRPPTRPPHSALETQPARRPAPPRSTPVPPPLPPAPPRSPPLFSRCRRPLPSLSTPSPPASPRRAPKETEDRPAGPLPATEAARRAGHHIREQPRYDPLPAPHLREAQRRGQRRAEVQRRGQGRAARVRASLPDEAAVVGRSAGPSDGRPGGPAVARRVTRPRGCSTPSGEIYGALSARSPRHRSSRS